MESYATTTADDYSEVLNWLTSIFGTGSGAEIWPSGKLVDGQWITSSGRLLFSAAIPTRGLRKGNCATFTNVNGDFETVARSCDTTSVSIGEFFDITKIAPITTPTPTG